MFFRDEHKRIHLADVYDFRSSTGIKLILRMKLTKVKWRSDLTSSRCSGLPKRGYSVCANIEGFRAVLLYRDMMVLCRIAE